MTDTEREAGGDGKSDLTIPAALGALLVLVGSTFAAVGVSDGYLRRAVRNDPGDIKLLLIVGLAAVTVASVWLTFSRPAAAVVIVLVGAVCCASVWVGADSIGDREQPTAVLSATENDGIVTITLNASASSLRSVEGMLVQIVGVDEFGSIEEMRPQCYVDRYSFPADATEPGGDVLAWQRVGADAEGATEETLVVETPAGTYGAVCSYVALQTGPERDPEEARAVDGYLRLLPDSP